MKQCNITDKELAKALDISVDKLYEICDFFDEIPDDDWALVEDFHFQWASHGSRTFSYEGAVEICNYLAEHKDERSTFDNLKRWLLRRDERLRQLMVTKRVEEASSNNGQLVYFNNRAFIAPRNCRKILGLGTRQDVLDRTFKELIRNENTEIEPPRKDHDFYIAEDNGRYFSGSGLASIGKQLEIRLTQKHRRDWVKTVSVYAPKALSFLEKQEADRQRRVEKAMDRIRKHAKGRCQVTNRRQSVEKFDLEVHHLYDRKRHPKLADVDANLIAIASDLHADFHKWMGGSDKGCTIEDFERYIEEFSGGVFGDLEDDKNYDHMMSVRSHLSQSKKMLSGLL